MSGLAALLAERREPGIYHWHGAFSVSDIEHTVEHAGWHFAHIDGWHDAETKKEFLRAVGDALHFPDYYGKNFDALADCLRDVEAGDSHGTLLLWDGWGPFAWHDEKAFLKALTVLGRRVADDHGGPFAVLLRGEGPSVTGVESLD
ncbi:barstar family protein [Nocardioides sp.]|uniref:barstar family protein n=1 Tax=Nocardioides sp. TaxID=35761 RepID=UPI0035273F9D